MDAVIFAMTNYSYQTIARKHSTNALYLVAVPQHFNSLPICLVHSVRYLMAFRSKLMTQLTVLIHYNW